MQGGQSRAGQGGGYGGRQGREGWLAEHADAMQAIHVALHPDSLPTPLALTPAACSSPASQPSSPPTSLCARPTKQQPGACGRVQGHDRAVGKGNRPQFTPSKGSGLSIGVHGEAAVGRAEGGRQRPAQQCSGPHLPRSHARLQKGRPVGGAFCQAVQHL